MGEDAAVVDFAPGARLLVAKSDPITFATDEIGFYAVNVCANDLAVTGATPRFYLPTLLLPRSDGHGLGDHDLRPNQRPVAGWAWWSPAATARSPMR
ncbi:MAG: AIR synthase related protein [Caldilineaceae bacterium]